MEQIQSINPAKTAKFPPERGSVVTIGNFDGCHLGHQSLLNGALKLARAGNYRSVAMSFSPHPEHFFRPEKSESKLFSPDLKLRAFAESGFDALLVQEFTEEFSHLSAEEFYQRILVSGLGCRGLVIGEDFRFGYKRQGNAQWLKSRGEQDNIAVQIIPPNQFGDLPVSSTRIRRALTGGQPEAAKTMLGRPYLLSGVIREGQKMGRELGCPTINLHGASQLIPGPGVYGGYCWLEGVSESRDAPVMKLPETPLRVVINCGTRPTFPEFGHVSVTEAHILDQNFGPGELYNRKAGLYFSTFLRNDIKFPDREALKARIEQDIREAKNSLKPG